MATYIFAIGGTGSRVLRSLVMLSAAGSRGTGTAQEIVPIIFDYDAQNGDLKSTDTLLMQYQKIHRKAYPNGLVGTENFFSTSFTPIRNKQIRAGVLGGQLQFNPNFEYAAYIQPAANNANTFSTYLGYGQLTGNLEPTQKLLDALYNNSAANDPTSEINMDFNVGFKGCPNIGCLVATHFTDTAEFRHFTRTFNVNNDSIIIVGSVFGGTGASGIPVLMHALRSNANVGANARISLLAMGPYYKISDQNGGVVNSNTFVAKFKAAMKAYGQGAENSVNNQANRIYYVADGDTQAPLNYCDGGQNQTNPPFMAELIGAMCLLDCCSNPPQVNQHEAKKVALDDYAPISRYDQNRNQWVMPTQDYDGMQHGNHFRWKHFDNSGLKIAYLRPMVRLAFLERFLRQHQPGAGENWWNDPNRGIGSVPLFLGDLTVFLNSFTKYLVDLRGNHRPMDLINTAAQQYDKFLDDVPLAEKKSLLNLNPWQINDKKISDEMVKQWRDYTNPQNGVPANNSKEYDFIQVADRAMKSIDSEIANHYNNGIYSR